MCKVRPVYTRRCTIIMLFFFAPVRQVAMATAQVLFHRFFYSKSFVKHSFEVSVLRVSGVLPGRWSAGIVSIALHNVVPTLVAAILSSLTPPVKELNDEVRSPMSVKLSTDSKYTIALHKNTCTIVVSALVSVHHYVCRVD